MNDYTAFCQHVSGSGTIWISDVIAPNTDAAIEIARTRCSEDWCIPAEDIHVLGLAAGSVEILHWEDIDN